MIEGEKRLNAIMLDVHLALCSRDPREEDLTTALEGIGYLEANVASRLRGMRERRSGRKEL